MGLLFERMKNDGKYMLKVFLLALLSDIFFIVIIPFFIDVIADEKGTFVRVIASSILLGGGVTLSYVSLMIWIKISRIFKKIFKSDFS